VLSCPNVFFNETAVRLSKYANNPYTLFISQSDSHELEIAYWAISFETRTFRLLNAYISHTENCTNEEARQYPIATNSLMHFQTKSIIAVAEKSSSPVVVSSVLAFQVVSINVSQLLIGLINISNFMILINLLNIKLGFYFDIIFQTMTQSKFELANLPHYNPNKALYSDAYSSSRSRLWRFITRSDFRLIYTCSLAWLIISTILDIALKLSNAKRAANIFTRILKWARSKLALIFSAYMEFCFMGIIPVFSRVVAQSKTNQDALECFRRTFANVVVVWGLFYAKKRRFIQLMKLHSLQFASEIHQCRRCFSPKLVHAALHEQIDESLQIIVSIVLFVFQKYPAQVLNMLVVYSFIQMYLCVFFAGKYSFLITATKSLFSLCFLFFIATASKVYNKTIVQDQFLNIIVLALFSLKTIETIVASIVSISVERKLKKRKIDAEKAYN
jgi:hypothetical protein